MSTCMHRAWLVAALCLPMVSGAAEPDFMTNVVRLQASAQREITQDWLVMVAGAQVQNRDAVLAQEQLKKIIQGALERAKADSRSGDMEVNTGTFSVQPRYGRDGQIQQWVALGELVVQGRDTARIARTVSALNSMVVKRSYFALSRAALQNASQDLRQEAITQFRTRANEVAKGFGFTDYTLGEVTLEEGGGQTPPLVSPRLMAMAAAEPESAGISVPAEPGKSLVQVTVSGTVKLR